jgi:2,3-dihydroxybiphenyl 1,2-dioxygenase
MIEALGYVGIRSDRIDDWASFGGRWLGLQLTERTGSSLRFRMDDRKQRLMVVQGRETLGGGDTGQLFGWEVANPAALDALGARLDSRGVRVSWLDRATCGHRRIRDGITFADPCGNRLEAFHGAEVASEPFVPGRPISGFRTGALGMGHVVLRVRHDSLEPSIAFYQHTLGLALSDYSLQPFVAYFFHANPRHHSVALIGSDTNAVHHLMVELCSLDDVGQAYDMALAEPGRIATTLGRHTNDHVTSFYATTPSDFFFEYGWGGRTLDVACWQPYEMHYGTSLWGHERTWLPADAMAEAHRLRAKAAAEGQREPVQVMPGNYVVGHGVCPWWDSVKTGYRPD